MRPTNGIDMEKEIQNALDVEEGAYRPRIVILACGRRYFRGDDLVAMKRLAKFADFRMIKVPCSQEIDQSSVRTAFLRGAAGVIVLGSHPSKCRFAHDFDKLQETSDRLESTAARLELSSEKILIDWDGEESPIELSSRIERLIEAIS